MNWRLNMNSETGFPMMARITTEILKSASTVLVEISTVKQYDSKPVYSLPLIFSTIS